MLVTSWNSVIPQKPIRYKLVSAFSFYAQEESNSQITNIPPTRRHRLKDDHLSMSLRFFNLPLGIEPNDEDCHFKWSSEPLCIWPVPGFEPTSSVFLGECVTHQATVADVFIYTQMGNLLNIAVL